MDSDLVGGGCMANYLVIKNGNDIKSYEAKTTHTSVPYLRVGSGYLDLTTNETMTSTTFNYTGQKSATYQTVNIIQTTTSNLYPDDVIAMASLSTTTSINSTYTSNGTLSVSYEDVLFSRPALMVYASARMPYSMYTTNSSEIPYNRVVTSGYDICTATQSITTTVPIEDIRLKLCPNGTQTYRPLEYHSYSVSTSTSSTLIRYIWNSAETTSSSVTTTTSNTKAQGASYCQTWIGSKVTFSVNITSTNGNTGTGTVTRNYVSMVATQSNEDIMKSMGSRLNMISYSYFSVDKASDKPISASYFISHTRKHSNATSENEFYWSANTTVSNATTAYLFSDTATSSTLITKIYPRSLESGSWTCTDYAVGEYKRTYSNISGNVVTKADGLVSISRVNISRTIEPVSSTTTLVTETNYYHDFTFTTNSSRTFSITAWKGTASLYTVTDNNRRYSQTITSVNRYTNRSSTAYDSVSYSLVESATTSVSTTISSTTEF